MKEAELRSLATCAIYKNKIGACKSLGVFFKITAERFIVDMQAVNRQTGLEMLLGGNAFIASAMGLDEDLAQPLGEPRTVMVCNDCSTQYDALLRLLYTE